MAFAAELKNLTPTQRKVVVASFLGWTLDAFDFFILVFVLKDVAKEFGTDVKSVAFAIMLTLAMRPLGALLFGLAADRFGRRPVLMLDVLLYSALEFATAFAPSLTALLILRALFGIAMGGEWGVAASLTMESIPAEFAWRRIGCPPSWLSNRIPHRVDRLLCALSNGRMARHVYDRCCASIAGSLYPTECGGVTSISETEAGSRRE